MTKSTSQHKRSQIWLRALNNMFILWLSRKMLSSIKVRNQYYKEKISNCWLKICFACLGFQRAKRNRIKMKGSGSLWVVFYRNMILCAFRRCFIHSIAERKILCNMLKCLDFHTTQKVVNTDCSIIIRLTAAFWQFPGFLS